jgi:hypothetical protein
MMESGWKLVTDYVKSEFEKYLPVPSIADIEPYRPLNVLILKNGASLVSEKKWKTFIPFECIRNSTRQRPNFDSIGLIDNFAVLRRPEDVSSPKIHVERLFDHDEEGKLRTVVEGQISGKNSVEGSVDISTPLPSLGLISRHEVKYRDLREWIEQFSFLVSDEDIISEAKHGNLFIIHDVIMAERRLFVKGKRKQNTLGETPFLILNASMKQKSR